MSGAEMMRDRLITVTQKAGFELDSKQMDKFIIYLNTLKEWNKLMNLTAIEEDEGIIEKHFIDSLLCTRYVSFPNHATLLDVGTGAGFPGIPLKIWNNHLQLVLLESTEKKVSFLKTLCKELKIDGVQIISGRAEDYGRDPRYRGAFERVVARAVARLDILAEYCLPFTKIGGLWIALKGPGLTAELHEAKTAINILGGEIQEINQYRLPVCDDPRVLVTVEKIKPTPDNYPRRAGKPKKSPLREKI
ncbi:MAG: 16S rRNA (guanine(527)-N(7))-methyltransferase RsmG [Bacillota bacterium]